MIVATPGDTPVTSPVPSTVAIAGSLELQYVEGLVITLPDDVRKKDRALRGGFARFHLLLTWDTPSGRNDNG